LVKGARAALVKNLFAFKRCDLFINLPRLGVLHKDTVITLVAHIDDLDALFAAKRKKPLDGIEHLSPTVVAVLYQEVLYVYNQKTTF
jgi:hypothetical protein